MIAKEMEKILPFDCKYADGVQKRTHRRLLDKTPVSELHLQTKGNHCIRDREGESSIQLHCQILNIYNFGRKLFLLQVKVYC